MKHKTFGLFAFGILALVLVMSAVSAVDLTSITPISIPSSVDQGAGSFNIIFDLENSGVAGNIFDLTNFTSAQSGLSSSFNDTVMADGPVTERITATISFNAGQTGTITGNINVGNDATTTDVTFPFSVQITQTLSESLICEGVATISEAQLDVDVRDITVIDGFGKDEEWLLFDEVEVEIRVENNGDFDLDDISLEWAIANDDLTDFAVDWDEIDEFNLKDGDEDTFTITFKVDDDDLDFDLDELSGLNYNIVVRATGIIDDPDNGPNDNKDTCSADFNEISIQDESSFVILSNFDMPETVSCGSTVDLTMDVWNIGDRQQDEVKVDIFDKNRDFIDDLFEVGDIDEFDNTELSLSFEIPNDAEEGNYVLIMRVLDEDSDIFENSFDDDPAEFTRTFVVSGSCDGSASQVSVAANTVSGGKAGQDLVVRATVTNLGNTQQTYTLSISGSGAWASSSAVSPSSLILAPGASQDATMTLSVNKAVSGTQTFFLDLISSDGKITQQPVSVQIEGSGSGLGGITGGAVFGDNWYLWGIGLLNLILVIIIIVVAVRIARRR